MVIIVNCYVVFHFLMFFFFFFFFYCNHNVCLRYVQLNLINGVAIFLERVTNSCLPFVHFVTA